MKPVRGYELHLAVDEMASRLAQADNPMAMALAMRWVADRYIGMCVSSPAVAKRWHENAAKSVADTYDELPFEGMHP